MKAIGKYFYIV